MCKIARKLLHAAFKHQNQSTPNCACTSGRWRAALPFFEVLLSSETWGAGRKAIQGCFLTWLHYPRFGTQVRQVHVGFPAIDDGVGVLTSPFSSSSVSHSDLNGRYRALDPFPRGRRSLPPTAVTQPYPRAAPRGPRPDPGPGPGPPAERSGAPAAAEGAGRRARAELGRRQINPAAAVSASNRRAGGVRGIG